MRAAAFVLAVFLAGTVLGLWWYTRPVETTVSVYFIRDEGIVSTLAPVERMVRGRGIPSLVAHALQGLLAGPAASERASGLTTAIPEEARLRSVRVERGTVIADFNRAIESGGGSASMLGRFWQIVYTATQFTAAPRVLILIEGQQRESMGGEGVVIDRPIVRPATPPLF